MLGEGVRKAGAYPELGTLQDRRTLGRKRRRAWAEGIPLYDRHDLSTNYPFDDPKAMTMCMRFLHGHNLPEHRCSWLLTMFRPHLRVALEEALLKADRSTSTVGFEWKLEEMTSSPYMVRVDLRGSEPSGQCAWCRAFRGELARTLDDKRERFLARGSCGRE